MSIEGLIKAAASAPVSDSLFHEGYEGYFDQHKIRSKVHDGDYSLAPQLDRREFVELLKVEAPEAATIRENLRKYYCQLYDQWAAELAEGHNLCLYGVGSKLDLVKLFIDHWSPQQPVVVVNAHVEVEFKSILNHCVATLVPEEVSSQWLRLPNERIGLFHRYLESNPELGLVLVVHGLDSYSLRDDRSKEHMCRLVASPAIRFVATVGHLQAPIIWSSQQRAQLGFLWHNVTTFETASLEHAYQDVASFGKSGAKAAASIETILASLTSNARRLFALMVQMQYDLMTELKTPQNTIASLMHGVRISELYERCLDDFIVSSEGTLHRLLSEYTSHDLIKLAFNRDGQEIVIIKGSYSDLRNLKNDL